MRPRLLPYRADYTQRCVVPLTPARRMGYVIWTFAIDAENQAHPLTRTATAQLYDGILDPRIPARDGDGYLLASAAVELQDRHPVRITRLWLSPIPRSAAAHGRPITPIGSEIVLAIGDALRRKLRAGRVQHLGCSEHGACSALAEEIASGRYRGWVYADTIGNARQAMYGTDNPRFG
jgi:hypothetical protein